MKPAHSRNQSLAEPGAGGVVSAELASGRDYLAWASTKALSFLTMVTGTGPDRA
jgi:hypothetical protein